MRSGNPRRPGLPMYFLLLAIAGGVCAQGPTYNLGRVATEAEIQAWDIAIGPDGDELPSGSGSAVEGAELYAAKCALCHGPTGSEPFAWTTRPQPWTRDMYTGFPPPLVGGDDTLGSLYPVKSIGSFWPYATTLWDYINRGMPPNNHFRGFPGTQMVPADFSPDPLTADEVYALTAFLLYRNGIIGETEIVDRNSLPQVEMPNKDGFLPVDPENYTTANQVDRHIAE